MRGSSKIKICKELDVNKSPVALGYALADLFNIFMIQFSILKYLQLKK